MSGEALKEDDPRSVESLTMETPIEEKSPSSTSVTDQNSNLHIGSVITIHKPSDQECGPSITVEDFSKSTNHPSEQEESQDENITANFLESCNTSR